jgi:hypothetical protein
LDRSEGLSKPEPKKTIEIRDIAFPPHLFYGTLASMGSKDKGKKEAKKAPKPKPKPEPGRKRESFIPAPPK